MDKVLHNILLYSNIPTEKEDIKSLRSPKSDPV